jgi:hypothetical protein
MVERTVKPIFEERLSQLAKTVASKDVAAARAAFSALIGTTICDPTMGSAPFLRSAFDFLSEQYLPLHRCLLDAKTQLPEFWKDLQREYPYLTLGRQDETGHGPWEWLILRRMLYGVDIDLKAVCIACQTFALSAIRYFEQSARFPSFFNLNLKLGNALISPVAASQRATLAKEHSQAIGKMVKLREEAKSLAVNDKAYGRLAELLKRIDEIKLPIVRGLVQDKVAPVLGDSTEDLRPFCWELEFPEVFFEPDGTLRANPGFDVVIGNPPWEAIKYHDSEFLGAIGAADLDLEKLLAKKPSVAAAYEHYRRNIEAWKAWVANSGAYEHQQGGRDRNKWRLSTELSWKLTRPGGAMSLVVPGGIIADEGGYALKEWMFPEGEAGTFISFEENNDVFSGTQGFTVMDFRKVGSTERIRHLEGLSNADQLSVWPYRPASLSLETVRKMSPRALAIPSVRDETDRAILEKLYRHPLIGDSRGQWYAETVSYDYHMGNDRRHFRAGGQGIPLLEGKNVEQYEVAPLEQVRIRVARRKQTEPGGQYRLGCADVAGTLLERRMLCSVLPHDYATGDKINCFLVTGSDQARLFLVGLLNSVVIEWRIRQLARSNNIKKFMLLQLPVPRPDKSTIERVASLVAALVTADQRFKDLRPVLNGRRPATEKRAREELKCLIDAEIARLFGLTTAEFDRVLEVFDKVPESIKVEARRQFGAIGETK